MVFFRKLLCVSLCVSLALSSVPCYAFAENDFQGLDVLSEELGDDYHGLYDLGGEGASGQASEDENYSSGGSDSSNSLGDSDLVLSALDNNDSSWSDSDGESYLLDSSENPDDDNFLSAILSSLEDIVYLLGEIADYFRAGNVPVSGGGISTFAGFGGSLTGGFGGAFSGGSGLGKSANLTDVADLISNQWGYNYGKTAVMYKNSPAEWLQKLKEYNVSAYYDGYTYSTAKYLAFLFREAEQAETLSKQQWGYNYGSGNTVVYSTNSPAGWLERLKEYNVNEYYDGYTYSTAKYLAFIFREMERANSNLKYNGSLTGGDTGDYSAARLLARVHNALYGNITYAETGNGGVRSAVSVLGYIANLVYYGNRDASSLLARNTYQGGLVGVDGSDTYGTARLLARVHNALYGEVTLHETGGTSVRSAVGLIGYLSNLVYDTQYSTGDLVETGTSGKRSLADLVRYNANVAYLIKEKLDNLTVDVRGGISADVDLGYIEARLDTIADLMKIGAAKDVVDAIVGDFDSTASAALVGEVQAAASNAFPFCVPALIKQIFGLVQSDPLPPVLDFEVGGQSLHVDCTPMQGFADVLGWACRFLFLFVLVASSRRFIYTGVAS